MEVIEFIKQQVEENPVVIFMKGTPDFPQCGFSARAAQALSACGEKFAAVNIFENPEVHRNLPAYSNWPTFPQIFIDGQLVGGCDITLELFQRGDLQKMVKAAAEKSRNKGAVTG